MSTPRTTRLGVGVRVGSQASAAGVECTTKTRGRCRTVCAIVENNLRQKKETLISLSDFEFEVFTQKPNQNNWKERAVNIFV